MTERLRVRQRRRPDGTFYASIERYITGEIVWKCNHTHTYGTSNRVHHDSASKCGNAKLSELRSGKAIDDHDSKAQE